MELKWLVFINPVSGGGAAPKRWAKLKPYFDEAGLITEVYITRSGSDAESAIVRYIEEGIRQILILGGDGTASDVVNGIMQTQISPENMLLAMLPAGTGNDWVRTIGKPHGVADILFGMQRRQTLLHDIGLAEAELNGKRIQRYFINITGLGFEGEVAHKIAMGRSWNFAGKTRYQLAIFRTLFAYRKTQMTIYADAEEIKLPVLSIAAGNGKFNGGGLKQLPDAIFDDGLLDMTVIGNMPVWKMVVSLPKLQKGTHVMMQEVKTFRAKNIQILSTPPVYVDADGEFIGNTPLSLSLAKGKVQVLQWKY